MGGTIWERINTRIIVKGKICVPLIIHCCLRDGDRWENPCSGLNFLRHGHLGGDNIGTMT